jgi:CBS domain containing-hemolysin-like protein
MAVDAAAALLDTRWDTEAATVGGLVTAALGHLPVPGERATVGSYEFEVERVAGHALDSALVRRIVQDESKAEE